MADPSNAEKPKPIKFEQWPVDPLVTEQTKKPLPISGGVNWSLNGIPLLDADFLRAELARVGSWPDLVRGHYLELTAGKRPARGQVVIQANNAELIRAIGPLCLHKLQMVSGKESILIDQLCVTDIRSAGGTWIDPAKRLTATSAVVVELSDARYLAARTAYQANSNHVWASTQIETGEKLEPEKLWESVVAMWKPMEAIMGPLHFHESLKGVEFIPVQDIVRPHTNPWDSFVNVLDALGLMVTRTWAGDWWLYGAKAGPVAGWPSSYRSRLLRDASHVGPTGLPAKITVAVRSADYQWPQSKLGHVDAAEYWRSKPLYLKSWKPSELGLGAAVLNIPGTEDRVFLPWMARTDDKAKLVDESTLIPAMKAAAKSYAQSLLTGSVWMDQEFTGLAALCPGPQAEAVRWSLGANGMTTRAAKLPFNPGDDWDWTQAPVAVRAPMGASLPSVIGDDGAPIDKWFIGTIVSKASDSLSGATSPDGGESVGPDALCRVAALGGALEASRCVFTRHTVVDAVNGAGTSLAVGRRVYCRWNYQIGKGGQWLIVAAAGKEGDSADWVMVCPVLDTTTKKSDWKKMELDRLDDPGTISINHASMLRLYEMQRVDEKDVPFGDKQGPFLEFQMGPPNTLLWSRHPGELVWAADPSVMRLRNHNGIEFAPPYNPAEMDKVGGFLESEASVIVWGGVVDKHHLKLPEKPRRSGMYLIAQGVTSPDTDLGWHGPGWDLDIDIPTVIECQCIETASGCQCSVQVVQWVGLSFRNGLLIEASQGEIYPARPVYERYKRQSAPRFNPCYDVATGAADAPDTPDPQPSDPDPRPQGPGVPWVPNPIVVDFPDDVRQSGFKVIDGKLYLNGRPVWGGIDIITP